MPTSLLSISEAMDGGFILVVERIDFDYTSDNYFTNNIQKFKELQSSSALDWRRVSTPFKSHPGPVLNPS